MSLQPRLPERKEFILLADHPALDLLNTVARVDGEDLDFLESDQDVLRWLNAGGWQVDTEFAKPRALLLAARNLRETFRSLLERRTAGKRVDPAALNAFLSEARSYLKLETTKDEGLQLTRKWKQRSAQEILAPLAESAADLLAHGDFSLIRRCESKECILWFYDRTKSHHRRWCSMASCGNRHKVAEYRKRRQANT